MVNRIIEFISENPEDNACLSPLGKFGMGNKHVADLMIEAIEGKEELKEEHKDEQHCPQINCPNLKKISFILVLYNKYTTQNTTKNISVIESFHNIFSQNDSLSMNDFEVCLTSFFCENQQAPISQKERKSTDKRWSFIELFEYFFITTTTIDILDMYHHIIDHHMTDQQSIQRVVDYIHANVGECHGKCVVMDRNSRNRVKDHSIIQNYFDATNDKDLELQKTVDMIHCNLMHSIIPINDANCTDQKYDSDQDSPNGTKISDKVYLNEFKGDKDTKNKSKNKFLSNINNVTENEYSFGVRFYYWKYYLENDKDINHVERPEYIKWYIKPIYDDLKAEVLHNTIYPIHINAYNSCYSKSGKINGNRKNKKYKIKIFYI